MAAASSHIDWGQTDDSVELLKGSSNNGWWGWVTGWIKVDQTTDMFLKMT